MLQLHPIPADALSRRKGLVDHWGVVLADDLVLDIVPDSLPRLVPLAVFADGNGVNIYSSPNSERAAILTRAWQVVENPRAYDLLSNNCQHLKNYVLTGRRYSEDLQAWTAIATLAAVAVLANR